MNASSQELLPLAALSPEERALERCRILQPCIDENAPLTHTARHHGIPLRPAQRWLAQYRRDGFAGLARRRRSDHKQPHGLQPELKALIEGLALRKPPPSTALVHRQVRDVALRNGCPIPNYHRVYRVMKQLDPALVTLAHEGSHAYRNTDDLLFRHEAENSNDIWQADHTLLTIGEHLCKFPDGASI
jgi:putative transposase